MARLHTPTNILKMRGSKRAKYGREKEPVTRITTTLPPDYISTKGKEHWATIQNEMDVMGVYSDADRLAVSMLCDALAEYLYARDMCDEEGHVLNDPTTGKSYKNPWVEIKKAAFEQVTQAMKQMGFTPAARSHLTVGTKTEAVDPLEKIMSH